MTDYTELVKALRELAEDDNDEAAQAANAIEELQNIVKDLQYEIDIDSDIIRELDNARPRWIPEKPRRINVCARSVSPCAVP